jgi:hypothetical protein
MSVWVRVVSSATRDYFLNLLRSTIGATATTAPATKGTLFCSRGAGSGVDEETEKEEEGEKKVFTGVQETQEEKEDGRRRLRAPCQNRLPILALLSIEEYRNEIGPVKKWV